MGCWHTKHDINDRHPNIFKVMNVDEQGQLVSPGQLELTETEMVLYQKGKTSTKWPLAYIRRYGFESELFSFECGRRCPTGPGIYAFRCRRAELLFNLLQERIAFQRTVQDDTATALTNTHGPNDFPVPLVTTGPAVPIRPLSQSGDSVEPLTRHIISRTQSTGFQATRLNSISSNGPLSPTGAITPPPITSPEPPTPAEHNNNKRVSLTLIDHSYSNTILPETDIVAGAVSTILPSTTIAQFVNTDPAPVSPSPSITSETCSQFNTDIGNCHLYMNVTPGDISPAIPLLPNCNLSTPFPKLIAEVPTPYNIIANELPSKVALPLLEEEDQRHCYANLETDEIEGLRNRLRPVEINTNATTNSTTMVTTREVVYAILDLDKTKEEIQNNYLTIPPPDSPKKLAKGYTIIDFNKTEAVSQIAKPKQDCEGSRKTRHNSTINELGHQTSASASARHSSSQSD